jgi:tight adherence protein B
MSLLVLGFVIILLLTFGLIALLTRPSHEEKALDRRLSEFGRADSSAGKRTSSTGQLVKSEAQGDTSWLGDVLEGYVFAQKCQLLILQARSSTTLERFTLTSLAFACGAFLLSYFFLSFLPAQLLAALIAGALPWFGLVYKRSKRLKAFNGQLANSVDMMSNALRAGHSVVGALGILAEQKSEPSASEFREVFRQQNFGLPLREALTQMLERVPSEDLRVVVTAILVQKESGGNLGEILDSTVFVIRERVRIHGEIQTQTAQGRLTGWILCLLPVFMMVVINFINPGYSKVLFEDPFGRKLLYIGAGLLTTGMLTIRHLINKIEV